MIEGRQLNRSAAFSLWKTFAEAIGLSKLREAMGSYWPREPVAGEAVFQWEDEEGLIGWTSVRKDPIEPVFWLNTGVFPDRAGRGYSVMISRRAIQHGFEIFPDTRWCFGAVSLKAKAPSTWHREWVYVGEILIPEPGYRIKGIDRETWNKFISS